MFPERFSNKTNGVTPRRWLLLANPALARTDHRGHRRRLDHRPRPAAQAQAARRRCGAFATPSARPSAQAKVRFADWLKATTGQMVDPDTHLRLPGQAHPRVQAAAAQRPAHRRALQPAAGQPRTWTCRRGPSSSPARRRPPTSWPRSSSSSSTTWPAPSTATRPCAAGSRCCSCPSTTCRLAERLIPASDVSNQISTAGYEASGTSNMKFMMNGALTIGTRDGATIEMAEEAGEENFFLFGLTAEQVAGSRGWYNPHWHYDHEPETRAALDLIFADHFSRNEPGDLRAAPRHAADARRPLHAPGRPARPTWRRTSGSATLYARPDGWARKAILNVAGSGKFSSDRTIAEYAAEIWNAKPVPGRVRLHRSEGAATMASQPARRKACRAVDARQRAPAGDRLLHGATRPVRARPARRVRHLRASRAPRSTTPSTRRTSWPSPRPSAIPQAAGHRRAALHRHRHPRPLGAGLRQRAGGAGGQRRRGHGRCRATATRRPQSSRTRSSPTTAAATARLGRRHRHHAVAQPAARSAASSTTRRSGGPADTHVTEWIEQRPMRFIADGLRGVARVSVRARPQGLHHAPAHVPRGLRGRSSCGGGPGGDPREPRPHRAWIRWAAPASPTGTPSASATASISRS